MRLLAALAFTSTSLLAHRIAAADQCSAARVMVVLDKSSSMVTGSINGATKWSIAVDGLGQVLSAHEANAEFGLMTFPRNGQCSAGSVDVAPATTNRTAILGALSEPPPTTGNYTPMAQTLEVAASEPALVSGAGARHVVVITDGWQWCYPYDPSTRFDGTAAVEQLHAMGITTWVVGFGAEVDASALNQMAVTANTARPGCNPNNTDPTAADQCYFQVDNAAQLVTALNAIAGSISAETCDGVDNDCDGEVDEDVTRSCMNSCGMIGQESCSSGTWGSCEAPATAMETCDDDGEPPNQDDGGDLQAGCGCASSELPDAGALVAFAVIGLIVLRRRR